MNPPLCIDSHCHLAGTEFDADRADVIARARAAGVARCLVILGADDDAEVARAEEVSAFWPGVKYAVGVHPHHAHRFTSQPDASARQTAAALDRIDEACAVGEIGLDYHYDFSPRDAQQAVFRAQLRLARERQLPVVIHTREAEEDTLRLIHEEGGGALRGVFHCFTGDARAASRALAAGFHVSLPGIVTFPKATDLRAAVPTVPDERLLIETDSPFLAPIPYRGKRNEPAHVVKVFECVAELRGVSRTVLSSRLVANYDALFGPAASVALIP